MGCLRHPCGQTHQGTRGLWHKRATSRIQNGQTPRVGREPKRKSSPSWPGLGARDKKRFLRTVTAARSHVRIDLFHHFSVTLVPLNFKEANQSSIMQKYYPLNPDFYIYMYHLCSLFTLILIMHMYKPKYTYKSLKTYYENSYAYN